MDRYRRICGCLSLISVILLLTFLMYYKTQWWFSTQEAGESYTNTYDVWLVLETAVDQEGDYVHCILSNHSNSTIYFGQYFELERLYHGRWLSVKRTDGNYGFDDIGFELQSGEYTSLALWVEAYTAELQRGTYRLTLPFTKATDETNYATRLELVVTNETR